MNVLQNLQQLVRGTLHRVVQRLHRHRWIDSGINAYGWIIEQRCRCGQYRHHEERDLSGIYMDGDPIWRDGPCHPLNQKVHLRELGERKVEPVVGGPNG